MQMLGLKNSQGSTLLSGQTEGNGNNKSYGLLQDMNLTNSKIHILISNLDGVVLGLHFQLPSTFTIPKSLLSATCANQMSICLTAQDYNKSMKKLKSLVRLLFVV